MKFVLSLVLLILNRYFNSDSIRGVFLFIHVASPKQAQKHSAWCTPARNLPTFDHVSSNMDTMMSAHLQFLSGFLRCIVVPFKIKSLLSAVCLNVCCCSWSTAAATSTTFSPRWLKTWTRCLSATCSTWCQACTRAPTQSRYTHTPCIVISLHRDITHALTYLRCIHFTSELLSCKFPACCSVVLMVLTLEKWI